MSLVTQEADGFAFGSEAINAPIGPLFQSQKGDRAVEIVPYA